MHGLSPRCECARTPYLPFLAADEADWTPGSHRRASAPAAEPAPDVSGGTKGAKIFDPLKPVRRLKRCI